MSDSNSLLLKIMQSWRNSIPVLQKNPSLVYLDSAASALKSQVVIDALLSYYNEFPVNVHRGTYRMSIQASDVYELSRKSVAKFFNAGEEYAVIFTSGMTEASNLLANAHRDFLTDSHQICTTILEHHSLLLPWQDVASFTNAKIEIVPIMQDGSVNIEMLIKQIQDSDILAMSAMSNVTGYVPPLDLIYDTCKNNECRIILDVAQYAAHTKIDLEKIPFDAILCSAHKLGGPTGIGCLCIKKEWIESLNLHKTGGGTVESVSINHVTYLESPERYEAGTPNISGAIGFAAAVEHIHHIGWENIYNYEVLLKKALIDALDVIDDIKILGDKYLGSGALVSFTTLGKWHPQDLAFYLEREQICIRIGKLCAEPYIHALGCNQVARVSAFCYNTIEDMKILKQKFIDFNKLIG